MSLLRTVFYFLLCSGTIFLAQQEKLRQKLEAIGNELSNAVLEGDYETVMSHVTEDVVIFPVFEPPIRGKEAYRAAVKKMVKKGVKYKSISGTTTEVWECGDKVYQIGTFGISITHNESPKPVAYYGSYFHIWQKQNDDIIKLKYMMSNLDFNPFDK